MPPALAGILSATTQMVPPRFPPRENAADGNTGGSRLAKGSAVAAVRVDEVEDGAVHQLSHLLEEVAREAGGDPACFIEATRLFRGQRRAEATASSPTYEAVRAPTIGTIAPQGCCRTQVRATREGAAPISCLPLTPGVAPRPRRPDDRACARLRPGM